MKHRLSVIVILFYVTNCQAFTFDDALKYLKRHPNLSALGYHSEQSQALSQQAMSLPDPTITLGINNFPINGGGFDAFVPTNKSLSIVQNIPNRAQRLSNSEIQTLNAQLWQLRYQQQWAHLKAKFIKVLACLQRINQQAQLYQQHQQILTQEAQFWRGRLESGVSALTNQLAVDAQMEHLKSQLATLTAEKLQQQAQLIELININQTPSALPQLSLPKTPITASIPLNISELLIKISEAELTLARAQYKSHLQLSLNYKQRENGDNFSGEDFVSAQIGFTLPLWSKTNQDNGLKAAKAKLAAYQAHYLDQLRVTQSQLNQWQALYQSNLVKTDIYQKQDTIYQSQITTLTTNYESDGLYKPLSQAKLDKIKTQHQLALLSETQWQLLADINSLYFDSSTEKNGDRK